jgi:hypothetical protein
MISIARTTVVLGAGIALAGPYGVTGMAAAMLAASVLDAGWKTLAIRRHIATPLTELAPIHTLLALACAYGTGFVTARFGDTVIDGAAGLLAGLAGGSAVFVATLIGVQGLTERDRERLSEVISRWRTPRYVPTERSAES